jgi:hypothetical protein
MVAACRLKLPDLLAAGPKTADELAASTETHAPSMQRLLRGLVVWGVVAEMPDGRFASTPISDDFRSDRPGLRNLTIMLSEEGYQAWGELMYTLRTGKPTYEHLYGKSHFERLAEEPEMSAHFNAAMVEISARVAGAFITSFDFTGVSTVVDVGGGNGGMLLAVLHAHPRMRGILFDLAQGLAGAHENPGGGRCRRPGDAARRKLFRGGAIGRRPLHAQVDHSRLGRRAGGCHPSNVPAGDGWPGETRPVGAKVPRTDRERGRDVDHCDG